MPGTSPERLIAGRVGGGVVAPIAMPRSLMQAWDGRPSRTPTTSDRVASSWSYVPRQADGAGPGHGSGRVETVRLRTNVLVATLPDPPESMPSEPVTDTFSDTLSETQADIPVLVVENGDLWSIRIGL